MSAFNIIGSTILLFLCAGGAVARDYCYNDGFIEIYCPGGEFCCGTDTCCAIWWVVLLVVGVCLSVLGIILRLCVRRRATAGRVVVGRTQMPAVNTVTTHNPPHQGMGTAYSSPPPYPAPNAPPQYPNQPPPYKH